MAYSEKKLLVKRLEGQRYTIPDMRPIFAHWPSGQNEHYSEVKEIIDQRLASQSMDEEARKAFDDMNPTLLAASRYSALVDFVIWFGYWDDLSEKLVSEPTAGADLRSTTKLFVRQSLQLANPGKENIAMPDSLIHGFKSIAEKVLVAYDEEQRGVLISNFERYIDSTELEAEADISEELPSLKRYWETRIMTSGMDALLAFTEFAAEVKLPLRLVNSTLYQTLWTTTIMINSIVNDLISFKKEMKAGSVLSSVAILYQQVNNLDAAVQMSLAHLRIMVDEYDYTANTILSEFSLNSEETDAVTKVIDTLRTVNTGNLEWSLQAKRYGVSPFITQAGHIELTL
ncbi:hypothetical protein M426DRAFT_20984 [Hypoxylon sp. CI-4A]|nr:hypothetical protein M426DRAFT_20984 [Hypoxylon sp. CI-4A]